MEAMRGSPSEPEAGLYPRLGLARGNWADMQLLLAEGMDTELPAPRLL
jgi:hypothetical protein